jgi:hypothetical protein
VQRFWKLPGENAWNTSVKRLPPRKSFSFPLVIRAAAVQMAFARPLAVNPNRKKMSKLVSVDGTY